MEALCLDGIEASACALAEADTVGNIVYDKVKKMILQVKC